MNGHRTACTLLSLLALFALTFITPGCGSNAEEERPVSEETADFDAFDFADLPVDGGSEALKSGPMTTDVILSELILSDDVDSRTILPDDLQNGPTNSVLVTTESAVTASEILNETILAEDIATGAVTTDEILNERILNHDITLAPTESRVIRDEVIRSEDIARSDGGAAVVVRAQRTTLVDAEVAGKETTFSRDDILAGNTSSALAEVGRTTSADGALRLRAGRSSDVSIRRDGFELNDPAAGGLGPGAFPDVSEAKTAGDWAFEAIKTKTLTEEVDKPLDCIPPVIDQQPEEVEEPEPVIATPDIPENSFRSASSSPYSTFSIDVDAASYTNVRSHVDRGAIPSPEIVRIEEMINYFEYDYAGPTGPHPFAFATEVAPCPWKPENRLVRVALQGRRIDHAQLPSMNLVFLIDVSGSMNHPNKLALLKQSFGELIDRLRRDDRVAIVTYAGRAGTVLSSTPGIRKEEIRSAVNRLGAGGSTAGAAGIEEAYRIAKESFIEGGNNRVILATDGDFNVGISSEDALVKLIEAKREEGIFLSVLGFGTGNYQDHKMEQLADNGNGNYYYIDKLDEAKRVFGKGIAGTLATIAKDVKLQIQFNPEKVAAYRLIGYENRVLAARDFDDDTKDAGELGAGHSVTALYEVIPNGVDPAYTIDTSATNDYVLEDAPPTLFSSRDILLARLRYKEPDEETSKLIEHLVADRPTEITRVDDDFRFAAAVALWGMLLRNSPHAGDGTVEQAIELATSSLAFDPDRERISFVGVMDTWQQLKKGMAER